MEYKLVAELRPVIGSCHFYVKFNKNTDASEVVICSNKILVKRNKDENILVVNVGDIRISADSISGLQVSDLSVQFRIRIEPNKVYGSFKNEVIVKGEKEIISNHHNYRPDIVVGEEVVICCRQCSTPLMQQPLAFKRVLPLPTTFDTGDFFCHGNAINTNISPKSDDCLYGLYFFKINIPSLHDDSIGDVIMCNCCHSWLGVREGLGSLFWNSSVTLRESNRDSTNTGLSDFISLVKHLIEKELATGSKFILYCQVAKNETHYLLVWVIEKSLSLLTNDTLTNDLEILLKEQKVSKILYKYQTELTGNVKQWEKEINSLSLQISKQMMNEGLLYLNEMSQNIPEEFRKVNQMDVSYILL